MGSCGLLSVAFCPCGFLSCGLLSCGLLSVAFPPCGLLSGSHTIESSYRHRLGIENVYTITLTTCWLSAENCNFFLTLSHSEPMLPTCMFLPLTVQGRLRSSSVDNFGTNQKCVCRRNYGSPFVHRFWDTATYLAKKLPIFPSPLSFGVHAPYVPVGILRCS